jgi:hypothetical protein
MRRWVRLAVTLRTRYQPGPTSAGQWISSRPPRSGTLPAGTPNTHSDHRGTWLRTAAPSPATVPRTAARSPPPVDRPDIDTRQTGPLPTHRQKRDVGHRPARRARRPAIDAPGRIGHSRRSSACASSPGVRRAHAALRTRPAFALNVCTGSLPGRCTCMRPCHTAHAREARRIRDCREAGGGVGWCTRPHGGAALARPRRSPAPAAAREQVSARPPV